MSFCRKDWKKRSVNLYLISILHMCPWSFNNCMFMWLVHWLWIWSVPTEHCHCLTRNKLLYFLWGNCLKTIWELFLPVITSNHSYSRDNKVSITGRCSKCRCRWSPEWGHGRSANWANSQSVQEDFSNYWHHGTRLCKRLEVIIWFAFILRGLITDCIPCPWCGQRNV